MRRLCIWFVLTHLALAVPVARAGQLSDVDAWLARVRGAIERAETGEFLDALKAAAPPPRAAEFEANATRIVESLARHLGERRPAYVDVLRDERYGTTFRRIDLSAWYEGFDFMFYGLDLLRLERGWVLAKFEIINDLSKILTRPFPPRPAHLPAARPDAGTRSRGRWGRRMHARDRPVLAACHTQRRLPDLPHGDEPEPFPAVSASAVPRTRRTRERRSPEHGLGIVPPPPCPTDPIAAS